MKKEILILNYHHIDNGLNSDLSDIERIYAVRQSSFEKQIRFIADNQIPIVDLDDIINKRIQYPFSIALTADDGNDSDYTIIYPYLMDLKLRCAFFLITGKKVNWDAVQEMHHNGFIIGSHGVTHSDLTRLSREDVIFELKKSKSVIEKMIQTEVKYFSFPFGMYNKFIIEKGAELGYQAMFTTDTNTNDPDTDDIVLHRWSVKRNISNKYFSDIITKKSALKRKIFFSGVKSSLRRSIGRKYSDKLNIFIDSITKKQI